MDIYKNMGLEEIELYCDDIVVIEKINRDVRITLCTEKTIVLKRKSIKKIMSKLSSNNFEMLHSGAIVNLKYVQGCEDDMVMINNHTLYLSRRHKNTFKESLSEYISKNRM